MYFMFKLMHWSYIPPFLFILFLGMGWWIGFFNGILNKNAKYLDRCREELKHYGIKADEWDLDIKKGEDLEKCMLCFEFMNRTDQVSQVDCTYQHVFHEDCLMWWLKIKRNCPICRDNLR